MQESTPIIFQEPPRIPESVTGVLRYKLEAKAYNQKIRTITWIFLELLGVLLVLGIIWINVDWVKAFVTVIAILIVIVLLVVLSYFL